MEVEKRLAVEFRQTRLNRFYNPITDISMQIQQNMRLISLDTRRQSTPLPADGMKQNPVHIKSVNVNEWKERISPSHTFRPYMQFRFGHRHEMKDVEKFWVYVFCKLSKHSPMFVAFDEIFDATVSTALREANRAYFYEILQHFWSWPAPWEISNQVQTHVRAYLTALGTRPWRVVSPGSGRLQDCTTFGWH